MSNKLRYSNQNKSHFVVCFKKYLHTQKLLTILIAQLNLDE